MNSNNNNSDDEDNEENVENVDSSYNTLSDNIIITEENVSDIFIDLFNNPRFTGRRSYYYPPPVTISSSNQDQEEQEEQEEEQEEQEDQEQEYLESIRPDNGNMSAEMFINNLTQLILNPQTFNIRRRRSSRNSIERLLMHSFNQKPKYKKVLSEEGEEQLKKVLYKNSSKTNESCPIYYLDFEDDSEVIELPCGHVFTPEGIEKWLKEEKNECPICRFELKSKEVKEKFYTDEENDEEVNNVQPLIQSLRHAYNPTNTRSRLYQQPNPRTSVPHSYIDSLLASEEERQMEQAILASIRDLESNDENEDENEDEDVKDELDNQSID